MSKKIRIGIVGYGNVGKGAEKAVLAANDMDLVAVFSRRQLSSVDSNVPVVLVNDAHLWQDKIDVLLLCGGSATDLRLQTPEFTSLFNTVDSFDTHATIPEHFATVNEVAKANNTVSIISVGWDPGLFSLNRIMAQSILPNGTDYTFWGPGVSQGHSDAIRRIPGVKNAKQYTVPVTSAIEQARSGNNIALSTREKHTRNCYVVAEDNADLLQIEHAIKTMPNYFDEYDTTVNFITAEEFDLKHSKMPHGGFVIRSGNTNTINKHVIEYSLKLDSNPEFTANTMVAYARAAYRLHQEGQIGAFTVFDIAPKYISSYSNEELRKNYL